MTHQNYQTNGASLEDCHTNFFALVSTCEDNFMLTKESEYSLIVISLHVFLCSLPSNKYLPLPYLFFFFFFSKTLSRQVAAPPLVISFKKMNHAKKVWYRKRDEDEEEEEKF